MAPLFRASFLYGFYAVYMRFHAVEERFFAFLCVFYATEGRFDAVEGRVYAVFNLLFPKQLPAVGVLAVYLLY